MPMLPDAIKNLVHPRDADALDAAMQEHQAIREKIADLSERNSKLSHLLSEETLQLGDLAITAEGTGDTSKYDEAVARTDKLEKDIRLASDAQAALNERLAEAFKKIALLRSADQVKHFKRWCDKRAQSVEELAEALDRYIAAYKKVVDESDKIRRGWPNGLPPLGILCGIADIQHLTELEMLRKNPVHPLQRGGVTVPGQHHGTLVGDATKLKPMATAIAEANEKILGVIAKLPTAEANPKAAPAPKTPERERVETITAATQSADAIMSMQAKRPRVTLDTRVGKGGSYA